MNMGWGKKIIQVKDESNLNAMTIVLKFVVGCKYLSLEEAFKVFTFPMVSPKLVNMQW
jgi:hypothetical protein